MRRFFENPLAFLLSHASNYSEGFALAVFSLELLQAGENLLFGFVADAAGIVEDQFRLLGRFGGSALMKSVPAPRLLSIFGAGSLVSIVIALSVSGPASVWAIVLIGFFHSIMFPTIFALSIKNLGPLTKRGASLQVMAILGGALLPALMGRISDATNIRTAFVVPLVCYVYIFYFAAMGYKPRKIASEEPHSMAHMARQS